MGLIHDAKKSGAWELSFIEPPEVRQEMYEAKRAKHKGHKWISNNGEGVRFAHSATYVPKEVMPEVVPVEPVSEIAKEE